MMRERRIRAEAKQGEGCSDARANAS